MTDDELREAARKGPNGIYAVKICRNCKTCFQHPNGNWKTAVIVDVCVECFDEKKKVQ